MEYINLNSKNGIINLFSDFIVKQFKDDDAIIKVIDVGVLIVIKGVTTAKNKLDIHKLKLEFISKYSELLNKFGYEAFNVMDLITYNEKIDQLNNLWITTIKNNVIKSDSNLFDLVISSEYPHGHSLNCGRNIYYYTHYVCNHIYSLTNTNEIDFFYTNNRDVDDDLKIKINTKSILPNKKIKSLILDVFDFDLIEFNKRLQDYDICLDILEPNSPKPYLVQDRLTDTIFF